MKRKVSTTSLKPNRKPINYSALKSNIFYMVFFGFFTTSLFINQIPNPSGIPQAASRPNKVATSPSPYAQMNNQGEEGEAENDDYEETEESNPLNNEPPPGSSPTYVKLLDLKKQLSPLLKPFTNFSYTGSMFRYFAELQPTSIVLPSFNVLYEQLEPRNISFPLKEVIKQERAKNIPKEVSALTSFLHLGENYWKRFLYVISSQLEDKQGSVTFPVLNQLSESICKDAKANDEAPLSVEVREELRYFDKSFQNPSVSSEKIILFQECSPIVTE